MKRNRFVKNKKRKIEGRWIFLIVGLLVTTVAFIYAHNKESKPQYTYTFEETSNIAHDYEKSEVDQMDGMKQESLSAEVVVLGMKAQSICFDFQYEEYLNSLEEFSEEELFLLQQIVFAEAGEVTPRVQKGVTNVILNRIKSQEYPNSLESVIFQKDQFSPTEEDKIFFWDWPDNETCYYREVEETDITEEVKESVMSAIGGENPIEDMTGFYSLRWITDEELAKREKVGFYSSDWVLDENLNPIEPVEEDVIIMDGIVFHGDWP